MNLLTRPLGRGGWLPLTVGLGFLVGGLGVLAAPAVQHAIELESRRSLESQRWLLVRSELAREAGVALEATPEVFVLARFGSGQILAPGSAEDWGPDNLVVFEVRAEDWSRDGPRLLDAVPGAVDVVERGPRGGEKVTRMERNLAWISASILFAAALAGLLLGPGWAVEGRLLARREDFGLRVLMGAEPHALSNPLVAQAGSGLAVGVACALAGAGAAGIPVDIWLRPAALLGLFLVSVAGILLASSVSRRSLERMARSILGLLVSLLLPVLDSGLSLASSSRSSVPSGIDRSFVDPDPFPSVADFGGGAAGEVGVLDSAGLAREMAVCRRALRIARIRTSVSEQRALVAASHGDDAMRSLATARRGADRDEALRWESRCEDLERIREQWRDAKRAWRQRNPLIEGRRLPIDPATGPDRGGRTGGASVSSGESLSLAVGRDRTIWAAAAGRVVFAGVVPGAGPVVIVDHGRRTHSVYGRIARVRVEPGDRVEAGQVLGGAQTGVVHFEVRKQGRPVDPLTWISEAPAPAAPAGEGARSTVGKGAGSS
jgi:hypothetical protein